VGLYPYPFRTRFGDDRMVRKLLNGLFFGSTEGPAISIDANGDAVLKRFPPWLIRLMVRWIQQGAKEDGNTWVIRS